MSSFATAPSRTADKEALNYKQLRLLTLPEAATAASSPSELAPAHTLRQDEMERLERLLSQLEARSMALVPYDYSQVREAPSKTRNNGVMAAVLVALWLSTLALALAYIRYTNRAPQMASEGRPLLITTTPDPQTQRVARSVDNLAQALVTSSTRISRLQEQLERSNRDLRRISTKVDRKPTALDPTPETTEIGQPSRLAEGIVPRNWHQVLDIKPTDSAVPHKAADGVVDYWLVPRGVDKLPTKVLAIGTSAEGVVVNNLEDGQDYTLTPSGEWRNGVATPPEN